MVKITCLCTFKARIRFSVRFLRLFISVFLISTTVAKPEKGSLRNLGKENLRMK